mgnify:FL=1
MVLDEDSETSPNLRARELYFFALFRCLEAALLALWVFSPFSGLAQGFEIQTALKVACIGYLITAVVFLYWARQSSDSRYLLRSLIVDLVLFAVLAWLIPGEFHGIALIMLVNLAAGGLLLPARQSAALTMTAVGVLLGHYIIARIGLQGNADIAQALMFAASYSATVLFCQMLAQQAKQSQDLAEERGHQLLEMAQLNQLIIQRMRTGVIVLDGKHRVLLSNQAATQLNNKAFESGASLIRQSPELDKRLKHWRSNPQQRAQAMSLYENGPEVIPRFVALTMHEVIYIVFLEDSRIFSGRAEELQLAHLGRLSASIAHEIRNPLAAISYAQQLLSESDTLAESERGLLHIIRTQGVRMNRIIENILNLAKRETAQPQSLELNEFVARYLKEFLETHPEDRSAIQFTPDARAIPVSFDPLHLYQVLNILVNNALIYGHLDGQPAQIKIVVRMNKEQPVIEVTDKGPGIAPSVAGKLFTPFFSTGEHGTGLGLYIARQLAESNQARLEYLPALIGGSNFRLSLATGQALLSNHSP